MIRLIAKYLICTTGLDAAGPKFLTAHRERRLDQDDASFVDVIHTSQLGYATQIGHADFFRKCFKLLTTNATSQLRHEP